MKLYGQARKLRGARHVGKVPTIPQVCSLKGLIRFGTIFHTLLNFKCLSLASNLSYTTVVRDKCSSPPPKGCLRRGLSTPALSAFRAHSHGLHVLPSMLKRFFFFSLVTTKNLLSPVQSDCNIPETTTSISPLLC